MRACKTFLSHDPNSAGIGVTQWISMKLGICIDIVVRLS